MKLLPSDHGQYFLNLCFVSKNLDEEAIRNYYHFLPIQSVLKSQTKNYTLFDIELKSKEDAFKAIENAPKVSSSFNGRNSCRQGTEK